MIPYLPEPILELGGVQIRPFPVLACVAIAAHFLLFMRRAPRLGFDEREVSTLLVAVIFIGIASAHVFEMLAYQPEAVAENPLVLLEIWGDLSSLGGMIGGVLGAFVLLRWRGWSGARQLRFVDGLFFVLPVTLAIGRLGCGLQHDHRGLASTHWLAVDFPDTPRFDLGLLECFVATGIALLFFALDRRRWPDGFYVAAFLVLYAPLRFVMDSLRIGEARYYGWTPGQYIAIGGSVLGVALLCWLFARRSRTGAPATP